jgi:hypothetical protein
VQGDLSDTKGIQKITIPLTTQRMTVSYLLVTVTTSDAIYSGIKPLIVYGEKSTQKVIDSLASNPIFA